MQLMDRALAGAHVTAHSIEERLEQRAERFDAWHIVLLAVLLTLAAVLLGAMAVWCMARDKSFTGEWLWVKYGWKVKFHCT